MTIKPIEYLPPLYPIDSTAARVVSQKGEKWAPSIKEDSTHYRSENGAPKLRPVNRGHFDLTGLVVGRLTVLGLSAEVKSGRQRSNGKGARWAVRCSCGAYEHRTAKALKAAQADEKRALCTHCNYTEQMKQGHNKIGLLERERQIKQKEIAQAEAINNSKAVRSFVQKYANAKRPQQKGEPKP